MYPKDKLVSIVLFLVIIVCGCECVTELETEKKIIPSNSAEILFIHAMPDIGRINIYTSVESFEILSLSNLSYTSPSGTYIRIAAGTNYVKFTDESSTQKKILYSRFIELKKNDKLTFVSYGIGNKIREIMLYDSAININPAMSYLRYVHTSPDAPDVVFKVGNSYASNKLTYRSFTDYSPITGGSYDLRIYNAMSDSLLIEYKNMEFESSKSYTIVLRGYFLRNNDKKLECKIIKYN